MDHPVPLLVAAALAATLCVAAFLRSKRDAVALVSLFMAFLYVLPAHFVVPGAGAVGFPAMIIALIATGWWVAARLTADGGLATGPQPIKIGILFYLCWSLFSYALSFLRPLSSLEMSGADSTIIILIAFTGVAFLVADGVSDVPRLQVLLTRLVAFVAVVAAVGIIQFATEIDPVSWIRVPGLELNHALATEKAQSIFDRPYSTTLHPIEFSVVCSMTLPIALHLFLFRDRAEARWRRWTPPLLIGLAIPIGVSRSGVLGMVVALFVLSIGWTWRKRTNLIVGGALFIVAVRAVIPGLIGTIRSLILGAPYDPSVQGRISDIPVVKTFLADDMFFGRGPGTFNPQQYILLDNQLYGTAIASGVPGLVFLMLTATIGVTVAIQASRLGGEEFRSLGYAIAGAIAAGGVNFATFDTEAFPMFTGSLYLLIGIAGAIWRLGPVDQRDWHRPSQIR